MENNISPRSKSRQRAKSTKRGNKTFSLRLNKRGNSKGGNGFPELRNRTATRRRPKIKLLFSKKAELKDNTFYNIQIQRNKRNKHMYLIAQNEASEERKDDYYIELSKKQAGNVKRIFENDYNNMVDSISIHDDKLVLLNPNYISRNAAELSSKTEPEQVMNNTVG